MRKITALLLALVMALALLPVTASADTTHTHCLCGATHNAVGDHTTEVSTTFQKWDSDNSLPTSSGSYYLDTDVTMSSKWLILNDIKLCLNGHKITFSGNNFIWVVAQNIAKFVLTDCQDNGVIFSNGSGESCGAVLVGVYTTATMYGGTIKGSGTSNGVRIDSGEKFTMYGGTITGYKYGVSLRYGGDVGSGGTTEFKIYDGTITNCTSAGVHSDRTANIYMYGGTITGNGGGGIRTGAKYIYGGTITGNKGFGVDGSSGSLCFSGTNKITIKDNFSDGVKNATTGLYEGDTQCNVYLHKDGESSAQRYFSFSEADGKYLNTASEIGITDDVLPTATKPVNASTGTASRDYTAAFFSDNPDYIILNGTGNIVQLGLLIKNVNATAAAPEIGQPLDTAAVLPEGVNYVADAVVWYEGSDTTSDPFTGSAGEDTSYTAKITVKLAEAVKDAMRFALGDALTIPEGYTLDSTNSDGTTVVLKKTFTTGKLPLAETAVASGSTAGGQTLTADLENGNSESLTYQWFRETAAGSGQYVAIPGATGQTYTTTAEDVGLNLRVEISATDRQGTITSQPVGPITPLPAPEGGSGTEDGTTPPAGDEPVSGGHTPIRRQNTTTTADAAIGAAAGDSSKAEAVTSAKTFDAGIAVYGGMMVCAALGLGDTLRRRRGGR